MGIYANAIAHRSAEKLAGRHIEVFARNIPKRLVNTRKSRHKHIAPAIKSGSVNVLPVVFNTQGIFPNKIIREFFHGSPCAPGFAFKGGLSPACNTGIGCNFDQAHSPAGKELFNFSDFHGISPELKNRKVSAEKTRII